MSRPLAGWQLLLAGGVSVIAAYYCFLALGPAWAGTQVVLYCSANAALLVSSLVVARRHPAMAGVAALLAASAAFSIFGDAAYYFLALVQGDVTYPSVADVGYLAAYPLVAAALLLVVRRQTPGRDIAGAIDAGIVAVSAGYLIFELIIAPTAANGGESFATLVSVAYPVGDLMVIMVGARLLLGSGPRSVPLRMVGGYLALTLYADTAYSIESLNGTYTPGNYLDALWMSSSLLLAVTILHPAVPQLITRSTTAASDPTAGRLAVLAIAAVIAPTTMTVQYLRGAAPHTLLAGIVCNVLFLLVLARMAGLVSAQRHTAITDGLTGLRSRRFFEQSLRAETARAARSGGEVGMLLLDIDHFKVVNDTHGHHGGDRVLVELADRLTGVIRPGDLAARYGGEELAVLLPGTGPEAAAEIGERVRRAISAAPIEVGGGHRRRITVSVGVAGVPSDCTEAADLVLAADRALYAAKDAGRDRVVVAGALAGV